MNFNSILFLLFFPAVATSYFILPYRWRWVLLLSASYLFYMSLRPKYILVLLVVTGISYLAGLALGRNKNPTTRRFILALSLLAILGILAFFKYFNVSNTLFRHVLDGMAVWSWIPVNILVPLGISFYTLQTISYLIDVYRGTYLQENHAGIYALFVAFFPQITAGPISRANHLLPQYYEKHAPDYERIVSGLQRIVWGFFKKLVIADRLAILVNTVYGDPTSYTGVPLIIATYAFAFQIYCDFSGYIDIAIGVARIIGFHLMENFQQPYFSQSITEFWRRWNISLSNWLRDYIFYPLQRVLIRRRFPRYFLIILPPMVTMLVSGLWHGEKWTFLVWGALNGIFMVIAVLWSQAKRSTKWTLPLPSRLSAGLRIFATFNLVCFTWIFFRANSLADAFYIVGHLFSNLGSRSQLLELMPGGAYDWMIAILAILFMEVVQTVQMKGVSLRQTVRSRPILVRWSIYLGLVMLIFIFGKFTSTEFIYSRF